MTSGFDKGIGGDFLIENVLRHPDKTFAQRNSQTQITDNYSKENSNTRDLTKAERKKNE